METDLRPSIVYALGEKPSFARGDRVRVLTRKPVGHYRVPLYLRGKTGTIETVITPAFVDNEEEGYGRNAGSRGHYYRVAFSMQEIWSSTQETPDSLRIEIFESWLEPA